MTIESPIRIEPKTNKPYSVFSLTPLTAFMWSNTPNYHLWYLMVDVKAFLLDMSLGQMNKILIRLGLVDNNWSWMEQIISVLKDSEELIQCPTFLVAKNCEKIMQSECNFFEFYTCDGVKFIRDMLHNFNSNSILMAIVPQRA